MKLLVDAQKFYESIGNGEDRERFTKKYGKPERFAGGLIVELPDKKTTSQLGTVWLDWTKVGKLLNMSANAIYFKLMKAEEMLDIWFKKDNNGNWEFETLSQLSKERTGDLIERYRPVLQNWVDEAHSEHIEIIWSKKENIGKPDIETANRKIDSYI